MEKDAKEALQVTKEIIIKFIEAGRVSPSNLHDIFPATYATVLATITKPNIQTVANKANSDSTSK